MRRRLLVSLVGILAVAYGSLLASVIAGNTPTLGLDLQGGASVTLRPVGEYSSDALDEIPNIYRSRIDGLGVSEPEISRQGDTVVVNLPGVSDRDRALDIIKSTGKVVFRPVIGRAPTLTGEPIDFSLVGPNPLPFPGSQPQTFDPATATLDDANVTVGQDGVVTVGSDSPQPSATDADLPTESVSADIATVSTDNAAPPTSGGVSRAPHAAPPSTVETADTTAVASDSSTPSTSPEFSDTATDSSAATDSTSAPATSVGGEPLFAGSGLEPYLYLDDADVPENSVVLPDRNLLGIYYMGPAFARGELAIDKAEAVLQNGGWAVDLTLNSGPDGLDTWNEWASKCTINTRTAECADGGMAIVIDHKVISAPTPEVGFFSSPTVIVTGNFSEAEARDLAQVLNYGATPVEMKAESAQTVSATLGKDSLRAGVISGIIGIALVVMFMLFYYRSLAVVLLVGLTVSGSLLWSVITLLSKTNGLALTLAGVTGIIVSVGVTIDSYVVFFERLKDEVRGGKTFRASAARGFTGAWRTILAADTVSLIGAGVLWYLSVGSVRGFAFFLGLSTACDLVVAWFFTRPAVLLLSRSGMFQGGRLLGVDAVANTTVGAAS